MPNQVVNQGVWNALLAMAMAEELANVERDLKLIEAFDKLPAVPIGKTIKIRLKHACNLL